MSGFPFWRGMLRVHVFAALFAFLSCAVSPKPDYSQKLAGLRSNLSFYSMQGDYTSVEKMLKEIADIPGTAAEVAYGRSLLEINATLSGFVGFLNLFNVVTSGLAPNADFGALASSTSGLTELVHTPARQIREQSARMAKNLAQTISDFPDGSITLDEFAFYAGNIPLLVVRGEIDRSDLELLLAGSNMLQGIMALILTQDLGMKITDIFLLIKWFKSKPYCQPTVFEDKKCLIKFGAYLLESFPKFLTLAPEGREASLGSLTNLVAGVQHFEIFMEKAQQETDDQADDLFTVELLASTSGDLEDTYMIGLRNFRLAGRDFFLNDTIGADRRMIVAPSGWSSGSTGLSASSLKILTKFASHLEGDGSRMDLQDFVKPLVEMLLKTLMTTNTVAEGWGPITDMLDAFKRLNDKGISSTDFILSVVNDVLPVGLVELDLYGLLTQGFALRSLLPHYDYHLGDDPDPYLALEWECGFDNTDTLVCRTDSGFPDADHFLDSRYKFLADGNADTLPYIAFQDPGWNNNFYLDASLAPQSEKSTQLAGSGGSVVANNRDLNYVIHRVWDYFYFALDQAGGFLAAKRFD